MLLFCFLSSQENLFMIHHNSNLSYDIHKTINKHSKRQTHYLSSIVNYFDIYFWVIQKVFEFKKFMCFIINHDFYVITIGMHYTLFIIIYGRNTVILIFHVSNVLRSFMISLKYSLILLRYSSTNSVFYFYHHYFLIQYNC